MTDPRFSRTARIFGEEAMQRLRHASVAVFGIGGVGGYAVEALARSGIGKFTLFDKDVVDVTNINRQIIALQDTIGRLKCDVMRERILAIHPEAEVICHPVFYLPETASEFPLTDYDYVIDAVDTVSAKIQLAVEAKASNIPIISAMGAGNKTDPARLEVADLAKTSVCPLARIMRYELKKRGITHLKVVYSQEPAVVFGENGQKAERIPASTVFVPAVMGMMIAREVVCDLISEKQHKDMQP